MTENERRAHHPHVASVEPGDRLVILARAIQVRDRDAATLLEAQAANWARLGDACLGYSLYRQRSVFGNAADVSEWSHLELSYFRKIVPADVISELVLKPQAKGVELLRAEILLTSPSSFVLPHDWQGSAGRTEWQASLEYIDVLPAHLGEYRDYMAEYFGPAAATLVQTNRIGTFRSMETAAVLYRNPELKIDWNQIHLCEVDADHFDGFGPLFSSVFEQGSPDDRLAGVFAKLGQIRTVPLWTSNETLVEDFVAAGD
ncbi:hypothetical protein SAMIE_1022750 [Sphingobium amiense]|uniref:Uncharacterized protein n=1 Tax=Sphingobium amiense TaxID=135719 RepID=A0A494W2C0_9SPHN|nr:hypothetical protein [Sphingobium amiense]BBD98774.1 hypothetical protein SAMIE_1022750 [Sphingobium amiense]